MMYNKLLEIMTQIEVNPSNKMKSDRTEKKSKPHKEMVSLIFKK